jgi:hypothetical protein
MLFWNSYHSLHSFLEAFKGFVSFMQFGGFRHTYVIAIVPAPKYGGKKSGLGCNTLARLSETTGSLSFA